MFSGFLLLTLSSRFLVIAVFHGIFVTYFYRRTFKAKWLMSFRGISLRVLTMVYVG